jgi:hypothetical protein
MLFLLLIPIIQCVIPSGYEASARNWEQDIRQFEILDRNEADPDGAILFAGSSSIRMWSTIRGDMSPYPVIQRGFGGSKLSDVAWYAERLVYPHRFKALVLFVANDITGSRKTNHPKKPRLCSVILLKQYGRNSDRNPCFSSKSRRRTAVGPPGPG